MINIDERYFLLYTNDSQKLSFFILQTNKEEEMEMERMTALDLIQMAQRLETKKIFLNQEQIKEIIPHREPFLFLDTAEINNGSVVATRKITENDCKGHFGLNNYIFPGHLACEALAQSVTLLIFYQNQELRSKKVVLIKSEAKFIKPIIPGDIIHLWVRVIKKKLNLCFFEGQVSKNGLVVIEWQGVGKLI